VGAGPPPLTHPPERVPPARPFDERAADAATATAAGGADERLLRRAAWVAGCTGAVPPRAVVRVIVVGSSRAAAGDPPVIARVPAGGALPSVGHVARAVDAGRDLVATAAADGATVLVLTGAGDAAASARVAAWLTDRADEPAVRGPLGALWRLGSEDIAILCGVALGVGEHGLALVCDGPTATAAAALALAVQPALRPRLRAATVDPLGLTPIEVTHDGGGPAAVAAALTRACPG
jgi:hypothetical protein